MSTNYSRKERLSLYSKLEETISAFSASEIDEGIMLYCLNDYGQDTSFCDNHNAALAAKEFEKAGMPTDLEAVAEFFQFLLEEDVKQENGIVFTPRYIADYIVSSAFGDSIAKKKNPRVIDPACGSGIFLAAAAEKLMCLTEKPIDDIIRENIFGIDIVDENCRHCELILRLLSAKHGGNFQKIKPNVICADSLKTDWNTTFGVDPFDYIIGNPPYVNPHDMKRKTAEYLKKNYAVTENGVFNIFYAFIEKGMKELDPTGILSFIVPNNFLTIKTAARLRGFLQENHYIKRILNFGVNMVFKPVRTYNCIIQLSKENNTEFEYCTLYGLEAIQNVEFDRMKIDELDHRGWKLADEVTRANLSKIESQTVSIKSFIRTGIATLRDGVFLVEKDDKGWFKRLDGKRICIESGIVKPAYKIPELKLHNNLEEVKRYIIFPYVKSGTGYSLIDENILSKAYPNAYSYLLSQRGELDKRDKGKGKYPNWYAYGRTQGLNKYGKKLLFPQFSAKPKFIYVDDEDALFFNGYAVFENEKFELDILLKILNSRLMEYYVSNTSYSIEGNYYCYQKKYIERFSLPEFSREELSFIRDSSAEELDDFLWKFYELE